MKWLVDELTSLKIFKFKIGKLIKQSAREITSSFNNQLFMQLVDQMICV